MFRAQTLIFGLFVDWRMESTASRVSDFRIRMRGTWGGGKGLEVVVGSEGAEELAVGDDWAANAWDIGEYRMSSVFLIPARAKGCDLRSAGMVVLIVSLASFARAPLAK